MRIGNLEIKNNIFSAPMAGYSEAGYRYLCGLFGAGLTYTEMVSVKGLMYNNEKTNSLLYKSKKDRTPTAIQLFGSDPEVFYKVCLNNRFKNFEIIDINMGCPVRKIYSNGEGSKLLEEPNLAAEIVKATIEGSKKPVTVKMRSGIGKEVLAFELLEKVIKAGCSAITIHPRSRNQMYQGEADHTITKQIKNLSSIPVIASGDIVDMKSYDSIKKQTNCDGYMIGRASIGNPFIFSSLLNLGVKLNKYECIKTHIEILKEYLPKHVISKIMKITLCHYIRGYPNNKELKKKIFEIDDYNNMINIIDGDIKSTLLGI